MRGAEPHPNGCILFARVCAARAGGVRRALDGGRRRPGGFFSTGWAGGSPWRGSALFAKRAKFSKFSVIYEISQNYGTFREMAPQNR